MQELNPVEWAIRPLKKYAVLSGRAPRAEYWWYTLATVVLGYLIDFIDKMAGDTSLISGLFNLALLIPSLAVTVRRLHDTDRSGWWLLLFMIPVAIGVFMAAATVGGTLGGAGTDPFASMGPLMIIALLALIGFGVTIFVFTVLPGTEGTNRYGPDPYGPDNLEEVFA